MPRTWWIDKTVPVAGWVATGETTMGIDGACPCDCEGQDHTYGHFVMKDDNGKEVTQERWWCGDVLSPLKHPTCPVTLWVCQECVKDIGAVIKRGREGFARRKAEHAKWAAHHKFLREGKLCEAVEDLLLRQKWPARRRATLTSRRTSGSPSTGTTTAHSAATKIPHRTPVRAQGMRHRPEAR